ncbi:MAG: NAD(P)/FAD-dependent oxidoreductase [Coriobacteriia bacterium]
MAGYDVIVVGAGPGGSAAAKVACEKGLKVLLLERAKVPGSKNMSGSMLFMPVVRQIWPDADSAPWQKTYPVIEGGTMGFMADDGFAGTVGVHYGADLMANGPMVFRDETDKWFCEQAVKVGAELKCTTARDLIFDDAGAVKGVIADGGERFEAPITIVADGINSMLAKRAGLAKVRQDSQGAQGAGMTLCIKYVYELPEQVVADRSMAQYWESDGRYHEYGSEPVWSGGGENGDIWTAHALKVPSKGLITVACYQHISDLCKHRINIHQRMKWFLSLPENAEALKDAKFSYFNTHMLTWENWDGYAEKSYRAGLMVVGDAAAMINPMDGFGADAAMLAGKMAAETAAEAKAAGDYSERFLARYEERWRESFIGRNEEMPAQIAKFLMTTPEVFLGMRDIMTVLIKGKLGAVAYKDWFSDPQMIGGVLKIVPGLLKAGPVLAPVVGNLTGMAGALLGGMSDE